MKRMYLSLLLLCLYAPIQAQISANLMQHPDVSDSRVCFIYGNDLWIASKNGGTAEKLTSAKGAEAYPRFSPDGTQIAYSANYQGNPDVYVIPVTGGTPTRLTYHGMPDRVLGWTPDGKSVVFASSRESGRQRYNQFYTVPAAGGAPTKLPVPYGEFLSFSPDGSAVAFTELSRVNRNWKRYRGGMAPDILVFDLQTYATENITANTANDELPMWIGNAIYYMSDAGPNKRNNLWKYDLEGKAHTQLTQFADFDITFPESGPSDIIFEAGGKLYLFNLDAGNVQEIALQLVSDQYSLMPRPVKAASYIQGATVSPDGKRVVVQARGELFNLPATEGFVSNLTRTSGSAERYPAWSPDGKSLAYWSDSGGEYQLVIADMTGKKAPKTLTQFTSGFRYEIFWSPNSKKLAFVDQTMAINILDAASGAVVKADQGKYLYEGGLQNFRISWSPDSNWIAYARSTGNRLTSAIFVYNLPYKKASRLTSGYYTDFSPAFSKDGKYLFFGTNRTFKPVYSDLDNTFVYPNSSGLAIGTLSAATESLLAPKNDAVEAPESAEKDDKGGKDKKEKAADTPEIAPTTIDVAGFENRVELLDVKPGNLDRLTALEGKLLFVRRPNTGSSEEAKGSLDYYDFEEREVKTILGEVEGYVVAANGEKILVNQDRKLAVIDAKADQKIDKPVPTQQMAMEVIPKEEWRQIFNEVWRLERDYFYDPGMHGVDWGLLRQRYGQLIEQANSRNDVNLIIGDLIAELDASHTYNGGGDQEEAETLSVGYLGANLEPENGRYRVREIIQGAPWDVEVRSPLTQPGVAVREGEYILAVNGQEITAEKPFYAAFQGLGDATVELTVHSEARMEGARRVLVKLLSSETRLRHLAWIEANRQYVEQATGGRVGYVYVRSTGLDGQNELIRQFYGQIEKDGLIIDERFNSGGQIPDRFVELLDRRPLAYFGVRDGIDWSWPPAGHFGPKVMLINGFSGSGGDAFPDYFRKYGLGPLVGTRTWGGLIGISGAPSLIDNGNITVPTFRMYDPDGKWFREGYGVDPDIQVVQDFKKLAQGEDAQLEAGVREALRLLDAPGHFEKPDRPLYEKRNE